MSEVYCNMNLLKNKKIGVLGGGVSGEKEISLISAKGVLEVLWRKKLDAVFIDISNTCHNKIRDQIISYNLDLAFIALHGGFGEDGGIQRVLEDINILYTGSRPLSSLISMDKVLAKSIFLKTNVPTPDFSICTEFKNIPRNMELPVVIKPSCSGSSLGISIVKEQMKLKSAFDLAFSYSHEIIIESYIQGRELTVGILDGKPLAVIEIKPKKGYFDFDNKYGDLKTDFIVPAELEDCIYKKVQETGVLAHNELGCRHFSRVDMILAKDNRLFVLEVNSIPGLTLHSLLPLSAAACGLNFDNLILKMAELAL